MALMETLTDPFTGTSLNSSLWSPYTAGSATLSYTTSGAKCIFPASSTSSTDGDITSASSYNLTGSYACMQVVSSLGGSHCDSNLTVKNNANNLVQWQVEAGTLYAIRVVGGTQTNIWSDTFSATTYKWWRIRESGGTIYWDTSSNGIGWTNQASWAWTYASITAMHVNIGGIAWGADTSAGTFQWLNFNVLPTAAATSTLTDNFNDTTTDTTKWPQSFTSTGTTYAENGSNLVFTTTTTNGYAGYASDTAYNLTGSYACVQLVNAGNQGLASLEVVPIQVSNQAVTNRLYWYVSNNGVTAYKTVSSTDTVIASGSYNSTTQKWFKIRESSGTIYFDYSADATTWTNFTSLATPFDVTAVNMQLSVGTWANEASATTVKFDNFNVVSALYTKALTASLSFAGAFTRLPHKTLSASLALHGTVAKKLSRVLLAAVSLVGTVHKRTSRALVATLAPSGSLLHGHLFTKALTAALSFSGGFRRTTKKALTAGLSFVGNITRVTRRTFSAGLSLAGSLVKHMVTVLQLTGGLSFSGVVNRGFFVSLASGLSFSGLLGKLKHWGIPSVITPLTALLSGGSKQATDSGASTTAQASGGARVANATGGATMEDIQGQTNTTDVQSKTNKTELD